MSAATDMTLREPPSAIDAEQAVLGALMIAPDSLAKVADWLVEADFYRGDHRLIFRAIASLANDNKPCDPVTLADWFEENGVADKVGGSAYIVELAVTTPGAANIAAYAEIVVEKSRLRSLIDAGTTLAGNAFARGAISTDLAATSIHALSSMAAAATRGGLVPAKTAMKQLYAEMMERYQRGPALLGMPTPWQGVNEVTKGLRDGVLYIVGARPSMGKSVFAENIATFTALRGHRTAVFSVEMTSAEFMTRAIAAHGDVPFDWVEQPHDTEPGDGGICKRCGRANCESELFWSRYTTIVTAITESPLWIDDTSSLRIEQLMARARREHLRAPIRLLVIDHLHDMATDLRQEVRHEYGRITQGAKTLAKEFRCPVVLLAQLSRNSATRTDKRPTLTDLRESGEIEQKADVVLFLHREDYYDTPDRQTHLKGVVEVIPAKGRNIRIGTTINLANHFDHMRLDDWDGPLPPAHRDTDGADSSPRFRKRTGPIPL